MFLLSLETPLPGWPWPQLPALGRMLGVGCLDEEDVNVCQGHQQVLPCGWLPIRTLPGLLSRKRHTIHSCPPLC